MPRIYLEAKVTTKQSYLSKIVKRAKHGNPEKDRGTSESGLFLLKRSEDHLNEEAPCMTVDDLGS